ncbi:MAG: SDR family oxidoreductase [Thermoplasmatales archaeon]
MDYFREALEGKIGVVSGAGNGQGMAVVKLLLENGARIIAFSRSGNKPAISHENLIISKGDSTDQSSLGQIAKIVEQKYGKLDFLYNNHGIFSPRSEEIDGKKAIEFFQGNVVASMNTVSEFLHLFKDGGSIVNVGASPAIYKHSSLEYAVTKRAVEELTRKMASLLKPKNVRVNALMPGSVDSSKQIEEIKPFSFSQVAGKSSVSTLEVAYVALFLLSSLSFGINGQAIYVDGGLGL